jgi:NADPH:quinone reductase-like Zn-dependent oxidoreductase
MFVQKINASDLMVLRELIEDGKIRPTVERTWPFSEVRAALRHVGAGHSRGLNVLRVAG